jgi:hypothetical protein
MYNVVLKQYLMDTPYTLKILSGDTSFIPNKQCGNLPRNKCYKSKKGIKLSTIVDNNGIPLSIIGFFGNVSDMKTVNKTFNSIKK